LMTEPAMELMTPCLDLGENSLTAAVTDALARECAARHRGACRADHPPGRSDRVLRALSRGAVGAGSNLRTAPPPPGSSRQRPHPPQPLVSGFTMTGSRRMACRARSDWTQRVARSPKRGAERRAPALSVRMNLAASPTPVERCATSPKWVSG
jgi:hypothetical protein